MWQYPRKKKARWLSGSRLRVGAALVCPLLVGMITPCLSAGGAYSRERLDSEKQWVWLGGEEAKLLAEELCARWRAQHTEVATAYLEFRSIGSKTVPMPREDFLELLASTDLVSEPDNLKILSDRVLPPLKENEFRVAAWTSCRLWQEGYRVRSESLNKGAEGVQIRLRAETGTYEAWAHQATVYPAGDKRPATIETSDQYRLVPHLSPESITSIARLDGQYMVRCGESAGFHSDTVVDAATAIVVNKTVYSSEEELIVEHIQQGLTTYPSGITFPTVCVEAKYRKGKLIHLVLSVIVDAAFNNDIPESKFQLAVPAGTVAVNMRGSPPHMERLGIGTDDVFGLELMSGARGVEFEDRSSLHRWLLGLGMLLPLLILVALFVARRYRHSR